MFNLVQRITAREGIISGYQQTAKKQRLRSRKDSVWEQNFKNMLTMLLSQATGVPTGNHGLFHRYRIEAVTLEAVKRNNVQANNRLNSGLALLKTLEGISRSLNNLLERFHQSFFFYILVQNDRFVSIGDYMPCLALLVAPLFIKAFLLWLRAFDGNNKSIKLFAQQQPLHISPAVMLIVCAMFLGITCNILPTHTYVRQFCASMGFDAPNTISCILLGVSIISILLPFIIRLPAEGNSIDVLHITALLALGISFVVIGLLNFALGFLIAIISVPLSLLIDCESDARSSKRFLSKLYAFLLHPLIVIYLLVFFLTIPQFPELAPKELLLRALAATVSAITFSLMDCIIYGNWLYIALTVVFLPIWIMHWTLAHCQQERTIKEKEE